MKASKTPGETRQIFGSGGFCMIWLEVGSMAGEKEPIPINSLGPQELMQLRDRVDMDIQKLQQSRVQLQRVAEAFFHSHKAVEKLQKAEEGQEIMLPLSGSLYITGELESVDSVLVDIGTGYFAERSTDDAMGYCQRKIDKLKASIKEVGEALNEKQKALTHINQVLMSEKQEAQQKPVSS